MQNIYTFSEVERFISCGSIVYIDYIYSGFRMEYTRFQGGFDLTFVYIFKNFVDKFW